MKIIRVPLPNASGEGIPFCKPDSSMNHSFFLDKLVNDNQLSAPQMTAQSVIKNIS
jgi:hypothetical protein